jgi:hypothetical protein
VYQEAGEARRRLYHRRALAVLQEEGATGMPTVEQERERREVRLGVRLAHRLKAAVH